MEKWGCTMCGYTFDSKLGDQENGIRRGIGFEDLSEDWVCPDCGADKEQFEPVTD